MKYTIYNPETGEIGGVFTTSDLEQVAGNLEGKSFVEGEFDSRR